MDTAWGVEEAGGAVSSFLVTKVVSSWSFIRYEIMDKCLTRLVLGKKVGVRTIFCSLRGILYWI